MKRIIVGITGATGVIYGIRLLETLKELNVELHLIISSEAENIIKLETSYTLDKVQKLTDKVYKVKNIASAVSSGSFMTDGMVIAPCTIKTLSGVANSYSDNLIVRAADVALKERRRLILVVRETPLHKGHIDLMSRVTDMGGIILPPMPAFYHNPKTINDIIDHTTGKILDLLDINHSLFRRWEGTDSK